MARCFRSRVPRLGGKRTLSNARLSLRSGRARSSPGSSRTIVRLRQRLQRSPASNRSDYQRQHVTLGARRPKSAEDCMFTRRKLLAASAGLAAAGAGFSLGARAQTIKKPARIIVGFPAGGGTDIATRILAERLRGSYASTIVVENRPGAGSRLAAEYVKNAEPDGSTLMTAPEFVITLYPSVFKSLN